MSGIDMKVVMLGRESCGKTSLVEKYLTNRFAANRYQNTIGAAFGTKTVRIDGQKVTMGIWDTAGSEKYESLSRMYYRNAKAAVICYAVNDLSSWTKVKMWVSELEQHEPSCAIYICATKLDLIQSNKDRVVDYHNTTDYVDEVSGNLFETSSKTGLNVCELFDQIAKDYMHNKANHLESFDEFSLGVRTESNRSCCN